MKTVLCYGDSNTFGFSPKDGSRYDENTRWSGILKNELYPDYKIIEQGANNRCGFCDNANGFLYSAQKHFPVLLDELGKIDIIILAIGTNDLQFLYNVSFKHIEAGLEKLIKKAKEKTENIILIPPVILSKNILNGYFKIQFDFSSIEKSKHAGKIYLQKAKDHGCKIFDINKFTSPSDTDGLHYDISSHKLIAENLKNFIFLNY